MTLRVPPGGDTTLRTEFNEIERRLRRLESAAGAGTSKNVFVSFTGAVIDLNPIFTRLRALESATGGGGGSGSSAYIPSDFKGVGTTSAHGLVPDPGGLAGPTGIDGHVLKEDATWGFPFRGLVQVATPGDETEGTDKVNVSGSLLVGSNLSAADIECRQVDTIDGVNLPGTDAYQRKSDFRDLVAPATDGTQTDPPYDVVYVNGGLHVAHDLSVGDVVAKRVYVLGAVVPPGFLACCEDELSVAGLI